MFKEARINLTLWYFTILTFILIIFSSLVYYLGVHQLERSYHQAEMRLTGQKVVVLARNQHFENLILAEDFTAAKKQLARNLFRLNLSIILISTALSYLLAGKTLSPIEKMVDEQRRFIADAAHELRTPITAMKTALEVSLRDKKMKKSEAIQVLDDNLDDVKHLEKLSNQLLVLSSYQKEQQLVLSDVALIEIINNLKHQFRGVIKDKEIKLKFIYPKEELLLDKDKVEQLLTILIDNAISYSAKSKIVTVKFFVDKKNLKITVSDEGIGMSKEAQEQVFERFYRADQVRTYRVGEKNGFGLGLAIAQQIVKLHDGQINVKSEINKGSTFMVSLPF